MRTMTRQRLLDSMAILAIIVISLLQKTARAFITSQAHPSLQQQQHTNTILCAIPRPALFTQVISDVDDTLKSSGGVNVAGYRSVGGLEKQ